MNALKQLKRQLVGKRCLHCQAEFELTRSDKKFCSSSCKSKTYELKKLKAQADLSPEKSQLRNDFKLRMIKGGLYPTAKKDLAVENLWLVCKAAFWNTQLFTEQQEQEFKALVAEHFKGSRNADKTFRQLAERVCLAKRYLSRKKERYISKPIDWLNINYKNGLAGTESWYKIVEEQRASVPHYNEGIALFATAIQKYAEHRNIFEMLEDRNEFIRLKQHDLLQLYMNCIMHIQYFNV